eukprot:352161-Chlamydomonas_euryale.AAC.1
MAHSAERAQAQCLQLDETAGVLLIVQPLVVLKRRQHLVVQRLVRLAARDIAAALVQLQAHGAGAVLLRFVDQRLQRLTLRAEPEAV